MKTSSTMLAATLLASFAWISNLHHRPALAQEEETAAEHPIEQALQDCLEKDSSTHGMIGCFDKASESWDKELNRVYKKLMELLDEKEQAQLKASEKKWVEYRDAELKVLGSVYDKMEGTMYQPMRVAAAMKLTEDRAMQLKGYLDLLEEPAGDEGSDASEE